MKIHSIQIENIASLKGKHKVNFDDLFNESALFAITGKTGAGKSTILNCISLTLFGKVYKKDTDGLDYVTLGESSGQIKLIFSNAAQKYLAHWKLKIRKKNGELYKKPQLTRSFGKYTSDDDIEYIEKEPSEIIGLTFDQFCKTTILNQGQFAKFLTSSFKERKDILEKFYQGISLELLNIKLNEKIRHKKADVDEVAAQISGHTQAFEHITIEKSDIEEIEKVKDNLYQKKSNLDMSQSVMKDLKGSISTIEENIKRLKVAATQLEAEQLEYNKIKKQSDSATTELNQVKKKFELKKPKLLNGVTIYNNLQKILEKEQYLDKQLANNLEREKHISGKVEELKLKLGEREKRSNSIIEKYKQLDTENLLDLRENLNQYLSVLETQNRLKETLDFSQKQLQKKEEDLNRLDKELESASKSLSEYKKLNFEDSLSKARNGLQTLLGFQAFQSKSTLNSASLQTDLDALSKKEEEKANKLELTQKTLSSLSDEIQTYEEALNYHSLKQAIHVCLEQSLEEGVCVVCKGSINKETLNKAESQDFERLQRLNTKLGQTKKEYKEVESTLSRLKLEKMALTSKKESIHSELKQNQADLIAEGSKVSSFNLSSTSSKNEIDQAIEQTRKLISDTEEKKISYSSTLEKRNNLEVDKKRTGEDLIELQERVKSIKVEQMSNEDKFDSIINKYKFPVDKDAIAGMKDAAGKLQISLDEKKLLLNDLSNASENLKQLKNETMDLDSEHKLLKAEIKKLEQSLLDDLGSLNDPSIELQQKEKELSDLRSEVDELLSAQRKVEIKLAENRSRTNSFKEQISESQMIAESLKNKLKSEIDLQQKSGLFNQDSSERLIKNLAQLDTEDSSTYQLFDATKELLSQRIDSVNQEYKEVEKKYTEMSNDFSRKLENEKKVSKLNSKMKELKLELIKFTDLYELVGKDEFRNYILSLIETTLIEQTNIELETLYQGRYTLIQTHKKNRSMSEFKIKDFFRDGMSRKVSTLSGGETFLVSLAMAMALAELTRGSTQIDSLFIDEGFGTLDQDSIEEVFELLEKIQHSGKQIGIISHVQSLTSRIGINIQLEKNSNGVSNIQIVHN